MVEGLDLASTTVEGEIPKEQAADTMSTSTQLGAAVDEEFAQPGEVTEEFAQPGAEARSEKEEHETIPEEPRSVKKRLVLTDDKEAEHNSKLKRASKRILGRGMTEKKGLGKASDPSKSIHVGQEKSKSPTKHGENSPAAATESEARGNAEHPSPNPTVQERGSPTKPGENPTTASSQPLQEVDVEHQHTSHTALEETSTPER